MPDRAVPDRPATDRAVPDRAATDRARPRSAAPAATPAARRLPTALAAAAVVLTGLAVATLGTGPWADPLGDALYAALVVLLLRLLLPRRTSATHAVVALAVCTAIEVAQATGVPATVVQAFPPARYVLGTTFVAADLIAYAGGVLLTALVLVGVDRWRGRVASQGS